MVQFAAHGSHRISWEGDVMVLNLGSLFNREGVEQVLAQVTDDLQKRGDSPWAMLVDVRVWQGGTPDAFASWLASLNAWIDRRQLVAFAALYAESVQQFMGSSVRAALSVRLPYFSSPDEAACWQWLRAQGLAVGPAGQ
jgi:hypothetical protein